MEDTSCNAADTVAGGCEVQKALMEDPTANHRNIYRPINNGGSTVGGGGGDIKLVVNKMDDLLNQNTQLLLASASPKKSQFFAEENAYEVPHVLPQNLRQDRIINHYYETHHQHQAPLSSHQNYYNRH